MAASLSGWLPASAALASSCRLRAASSQPCEDAKYRRTELQTQHKQTDSLRKPRGLGAASACGTTALLLAACQALAFHPDTCTTSMQELH